MVYNVVLILSMAAAVILFNWYLGWIIDRKIEHDMKEIRIWLMLSFSPRESREYEVALWNAFNRKDKVSEAESRCIIGDNHRVH